MRSLSFSKAVYGLGILFLYIPIITLVIFSFNKSHIVALWGGFSTKWYGVLLHNRLMIAAAERSLEIGLIAATLAVILGTMAGYVLARMRRIKMRWLFTAMITAPLVMPEVITGISLLLLFISMAALLGWPADRGMTTIVIAHVTFCTSYVAIIIQSRLVAMDNTLEEAALDLGSHPFQVISDITLPIIAPAMLSGWLLSFTMSLDNLVISSFVTGPGATTLPIIIYSEVKMDVKPDVNALATIMIMIVTVGTIVAGILMQKRERRRLQDEQLAFAGEFKPVAAVAH